MIDWKKHFDKLIYNFTSRGFILLLVPLALYAVVTIYILLEPAKAKELEFVYDGSKHLLIWTGTGFLSNNAFKSIVSRFGNNK